MAQKYYTELFLIIKWRFFMKNNEKKKKNFFTKFLLSILYFLLSIILVLALWFCFSALDKKKSIAMIPQNFHALVHTDSLYDAVNPLLDLQAADIFLSSENMSDFRGIFINLRSENIRNNKLIKVALQRKIDAALYTDSQNNASYIVCADFGFLSAITRLSRFIIPILKINGISMINENGLNYFVFSSNDTKFYFKNVKNLVILSNDFEKFKIALKADNDLTYNKEQLEVLNKKTTNPIKIVINGKQVIQSFIQDNKILSLTNSIFDDSSLSIVSFGITDQKITLDFDVPVSKNIDSTSNEILLQIEKLIKQNSTKPEIISNLSKYIQYYTILNIDTLENLLNLAAPITMNESASSLINKYNGLCKSILNTSIDDLLFSWTDKEFAILGIEELNDPVFAIKISDEANRKTVFNEVINSFVLNENKSLILNGVRIPRLQLPVFLQGLLKSFGFTMPKPYYLVYNNYIYFSQSAESLSAIYSTFGKGSNISYNSNWKTLDDNLTDESSVSLFYDLERSKPFFINSKNTLSQIFELYSIGRADLEIKDNSILLKLVAISRREGSLRQIPGFPMEITTNQHNPKIYVCDTNKPSTIFWLSNNTQITSLDLKTTSKKSYTIDNISSNNQRPIIQPVTKNGKELLMVLAKNELFVLNSKLEEDKEFTKIILPETPCNTPYLSYDLCYIPATSGKLYKIEKNRISIIDLELEDFSHDTTSIYYDGKLGSVYGSFFSNDFIIKDEKIINKDSPIFKDKTSYSAPAFTQIKDNKFSMGILFQSGELQIFDFDSDKQTNHNSIQLDGIFNETNLLSLNNNFYALSKDGQLFKISKDANILSIKIDNVSTDRHFSLQKFGNKTYICVGIDGNRIYAFNENLELIPGFPIAGYGTPAFADVNGDNYPDCFAQTIDNKLNAWNLK